MKQSSEMQGKANELQNLRERKRRKRYKLKQVYSCKCKDYTLIMFSLVLNYHYFNYYFSKHNLKILLEVFDFLLSLFPNMDSHSMNKECK